MSLQPLIALVVVTLVLSAGAITYGAMHNVRTLAVAAAVAFAIAVILVTGRVNRPHWTAHEGDRPDRTLFHAMRRNTRLAALVYAWAALSFYAVYGLSGVKWQHGFQYGTAAALIAGGLLYYVHRMGEPGRDVAPPRALTVLHGLAVAGGLVFLIASGKLATLKGDWPANYIFLFGGLTLVSLCAISYRTQARLERSIGPPAA